MTGIRRLAINPNPGFARLDRDELPETDRAGIVLQQHIDYQAALGCDYINLKANGAGFPQKERLCTQTDQGEHGY